MKKFKYSIDKGPIYEIDSLNEISYTIQHMKGKLSTNSFTACDLKSGCTLKLGILIGTKIIDLYLGQNLKEGDLNGEYDNWWRLIK